jgi:hypothetical protein
VLCTVSALYLAVCCSGTALILRPAELQGWTCRSSWDAEVARNACVNNRIRALPASVKWKLKRHVTSRHSVTSNSRTVWSSDCSWGAVAMLLKQFLPHDWQRQLSGGPEQQISLVRWFLALFSTLTLRSVFRISVNSYCLTLTFRIREISGLSLC